MGSFTTADEAETVTAHEVINKIIVIDPMNEYFDIAQTYGGKYVNLHG